MTNERLAAIRARADMAAGYEFTKAEDQNEDDEYGCPLCAGVGEIYGTEYKHKELAGNVIAYGIGKGLKLCEEWVENGPADTIDLIDAYEKLCGELDMVREKNGRLADRVEMLESSQRSDWGLLERIRKIAVDALDDDNPMSELEALEMIREMVTDPEVDDD